MDYPTFARRELETQINRLRKEFYARAPAGNTIGQFHLQSEIRNGLANTYSGRRTDGLEAGSAQPFCSTPFMHLPKEERLARLKSRSDLKQHLESEKIDDLEQLVREQGRVILELASLLMDYQHMSGDRREEWLEEGSPEATEYKVKVMAHLHPELVEQWLQREG